MKVKYILCNIFRNDKTLRKSHWMDLTINELRQKISTTILEEENKKALSPHLRYDWDTTFSPEEWCEFMSSKEKDHNLPIDLPFVQLTANLIRRNILLIPILQRDVESDKKQENEIV